MANLRQAFAEICRGYSSAIWRDNRVFIKHLSHFDQVEIDIYRQKYYDLARQKGIKTEAEKLEWLKTTGLWTDEDDKKLYQQKFYLDNLKKTQAKLPFKSQIEAHKKVVKEAEAVYNKLFREKESLIDVTCERYSQERVYSYYIFFSFYKDEKFVNRLFLEEEFENIEDFELSTLFEVYGNAIGKFDEKALKEIAISDFFTSYFYNCGDNLQSFFGVPICELTFNQLNLLFFGKYYKSVFENYDIPENIKNSPEKIEDFINMSNNAKNILQKGRGKNDGEHQFTGIVGTKEDFDALGIKPDNTIVKKAMAQGGISGVEQAEKLLKK